MTIKENIFFINSTIKIESHQNYLLYFGQYWTKKSQLNKFIGVTIDEHINSSSHKELADNNISQNTGLLYKASLYLDKNKA